MSKQEGTAGILDVIRGMGGYIDENGMLQLRRGFSCYGILPVLLKASSRQVLPARPKPAHKT